MRFILTTGWEAGLAQLTARLLKELSAGKRVLWLTSGGSNIQPAVAVMNSVSDELSRNLTIGLADERFGPPGHDESNWAQLLKAGFNSRQAKTLAILEAGQTLETAAAKYDQLIKQAFSDNQVIIAQLGIGADGHIAGILPGSPAVKETGALVVGFESPPLQRLTLTFPALRQIDMAYVFAFGQPKQTALQTLANQSLSLAEQPAQILKQLPEVYVYNDQVGEII